jgi:hypothetical protein
MLSYNAYFILLMKYNKQTVNNIDFVNISMLMDTFYNFKSIILSTDYNSDNNLIANIENNANICIDCLKNKTHKHINNFYTIQYLPYVKNYKLPIDINYCYFF